MNEIKCNKYWANEKLNIEGFNLIYKCRSDYGGGVAFLIKSNIVFTEIIFESYDKEEIVGFKTSINKINHTFFSYYNAPNVKINIELFEHIQKNFKNYLIMGDLNAKTQLLDCHKTNKNGEILESILFNNNCQILNINKKPTFHIYKKNNKPDYHTLIDLYIGSPIYANMLSNYKVIKSKILDSLQAANFIRQLN